ncbi:MAG: hypothetical protein N2556_01980 [Anaerolineae bacterium]|nr:hypothetical protein [Anaerolineae bacterium]
MRTKRDPNIQPALFAEALREWLDRSGLKHADVAKQSHVEPSTLSHWLRGDRPPDLENGMWLLMTLHRQFRALGLDWPVPEALDGIAPLGWAWEDVQEAIARYLDADEAPSFRKWWAEGKPSPLPDSTPSLPIPFVPRTEQNLLRHLLTEPASWRQARWKAVILSGVAGIGKTTLLTALARDPALRRHFRNGILWLDGTQKNLLPQAAYRVGLKGPPATRREEWARWASDPHRRLLLVIDDALPNQDLDALVAGLGPQVVLALTTQTGPEIRAALERWIPREQVAEILLQGMREEEGLALIQQVQERPIGERERETVRKVGGLLGWHPEALRLAAGMAQEPGSGGAEEQRSGWAGVLAFLEEEGLKGGDWDPLLRLLERQWERMSPERREWVERLVWRTVRGGPLEAPLAGAIWNVRPEVARLILRDLERTGLVERVAVHPAEWWRPQEVQMWRLTPVVFRVRREADPTGRWKRDQRRWRRRVVFRRDWAAGYSAPPMPHSLALVATLFHILGIPLKVLLGFGVALLAGFTGRKDWNPWWERWTTVVTPITNLRWHLERREIWLAEELELLIARSNRTTELLLGADVGIVMVLAWAPLELNVWWMLMMFPVGVVVAIGLFLAWFTWLSVLYGVRTWDLALMVRLALALTGPLQWLGPVRRERERLLEAWNRSTGHR